MPINKNITFSNIYALKDGVKLLDSLNEDQYQAECKPAFQATIGAHLRHVIEHYQCFFEQMEQQHFCYDMRRRNFQLETDLDYAQQVLCELMALMADIDEVCLDKTYTMSDQAIDGKISTTLLRELVFLQSHTTHHFAIIAAMSRMQGVDVDDNFGVAIATLNHQLMMQEEEKIACAQ